MGRSAADEASDRGNNWLREAVAGAVAEGTATAAVGLVAEAGSGACWAGAGVRRLAGDAPASRGDLFDLASLTKPIVATLALELDASGELPLTATVGELWPRAARRLGRRTLEDLLRHRSGLLAWAPLYSLCRSPEEVPALLTGGSLLGREGERYSDLGYVLWGLSAERASGRPLGRLLDECVLGGIEGVVARPAPETAVECAADTARESELAAAGGWTAPARPAPRPGEPQDGNARFLGGLAGHAGLFGTADGVAELARRWLAGATPGLARGAEAALAAAGRFALGWGRPGAWSGTEELPASWFGHLGFTGGTIWVDPGRGRIGVLLAHRRSPASDLEPWRRRFYRGLERLPGSPQDGGEP